MQHVFAQTAVLTDCLGSTNNGVFALQAIHLTHASTEKLIDNPDIAFVAFTGSVGGGHEMQKAASKRFIGMRGLGVVGPALCVLTARGFGHCRGILGKT